MGLSVIAYSKIHKAHSSISDIVHSSLVCTAVPRGCLIQSSMAVLCRLVNHCDYNSPDWFKTGLFTVNRLVAIIIHYV